MAASMTHPACLDEKDLLADCDIRFTRRSGPGGQNRNKVETAVIVTHRPTGLGAEASERRSQAENRRVAAFRLRLALALEVRSDAAGPSELWRSRCRGRRIAVNPEHEDFPALLAEALDVIGRLDSDLKAAAGALECSASQLLKLLKCEPRAWALLNQARRARGLAPLL